MTTHWELKMFNVRFPSWRDYDWRVEQKPEPPADLVKRVDHWWRGLDLSPNRPSGDRVDPDKDPQGNLWWTWVPNSHWQDGPDRWFRVMCYYRVLENEDPRQIECEKFKTQPADPPA